MANLDDPVQKAIEKQYSRQERIIYFIRRHLVFAIPISLGLWYLYNIPVTAGPDGVIISPARELFTLMVTRSLKCLITVWLAILVMKFAFPKIHLQTELLDENNIAVALLMAGIILGMSM